MAGSLIGTRSLGNSMKREQTPQKSRRVKKADNVIRIHTADKCDWWPTEHTFIKGFPGSGTNKVVSSLQKNAERKGWNVRCMDLLDEDDENSFMDAEELTKIIAQFSSGQSTLFIVKNIDAAFLKHFQCDAVKKRLKLRAKMVMEQPTFLFISSGCVDLGFGQRTTEVEAINVEDASRLYPHLSEEVIRQCGGYGKNGELVNLELLEAFTAGGKWHNPYHRFFTKEVRFADFDVDSELRDTGIRSHLQGVVFPNLFEEQCDTAVRSCKDGCPLCKGDVRELINSFRNFLARQQKPSNETEFETLLCEFLKKCGKCSVHQQRSVGRKFFDVLCYFVHDNGEKRGYLFELKFNKTAKQAMDQIEKNQYHDVRHKLPAGTNIAKIAMNFVSKTREAEADWIEEFGKPAAAQASETSTVKARDIPCSCIVQSRNPDDSEMLLEQRLFV
eukprot:TRINITY_DN28909_c0_g1_i1.p1 TRINITY_DN28909_c0_g1~~TRINITY_DN28909_c0_g1_i1.p1  ORF type:complete len:460 (+),score=114.40 TRINITY_DN28909_c0_g1_i1:50-1381(+)